MPSTWWTPEQLTGVWSATPTPFTNRMTVDRAAVARMVKHHLRLGINGLFLCGTCGEGPWMPDDQRTSLIRETVRQTRRRMVVAVQVTDNSAARILVNMRMAAEAGADIAIIAPPHFLMNATSDNIVRLYRTAIRQSPLPVGIYDRGAYGSIVVPDGALKAIYSEPRVILIKDSSCNPARRDIALAIRRHRTGLRLLNGNEFDCVSYIQAGYDGLLLGGGVFNGFLARCIIEAVHEGRISHAQRLQRRMNRLMWNVYGGRKISAWLTGLKELLVRMHVFTTRNGYLNYPLPAATKRAIARVMVQDRDVLFP